MMESMDVQKSCRPIGLLLTVLMLVSNTALAADNDRNLAVKQMNNAVSEQRIALVIGNGAYKGAALKNPVNDAKDVAAKLRKQGFTVIERNNLQTKQIGRMLSEFRSKLVPGAVALVFYAGHGLQIKGENYLPAVDAEISAEEDVPNQSLSVRQIMDVLDAAKTRLNLVFLDACRNNPYSRSFRSATGDGLARISAPSGTLISYATRPGSIAADGDGRNGLYTSKLLTQMDSPLQIELALKRVVTEVKAASQGRQEPWMEGSIEGNFCFGGCDKGGETAPNNNSLDTERAFWEGISNSRNAGDFKSYLEQYPQGIFVELAKQRLAKLGAGQLAMVRPGTLSADMSAEERDLRLKAETGDTNAMYRLAVLLRDAKNYAESSHWMIEASGRGSNLARASVGWHYRGAQGQWQDDTEFERWCREQAASGDAEAMFIIGRANHLGSGVQKDYTQALAWYQKAVDAGNAPAKNNMGSLYAEGQGVAKDYAQAMNWFQKAADAGYTLAMFNVGGLYQSGRGVAKDYAQAFAWFQKAADAGNTRAMSSIGSLYNSGVGVTKDYSQALAWFQKAADAGNAEAMNSIGYLYNSGLGVTQDYSQALAWFQKAADAGDAQAMNSIGSLYYNGLGVTKDYSQALAWFQKAADAGNAEAMNSIGYLYNSGLGVTQDYSQALAWYRKAADAGGVDGMTNVGVYYYNGTVVQKDRETARAWFKKAAEQGGEHAKNRLKDLFNE